MPSSQVRGRVIVAGAANAGKTCLLERFVRNVYAAEEEGHGPTVGCDCLQKAVFVEDTEVTLFLYDTAGQERFADMSGNYYRQGDVCLLVFDLSDKSSYSRIKWWREKVQEYNSKCSFVLVGCKEDVIDDQAAKSGGVTSESAVSTAAQVGGQGGPPPGNSAIHDQALSTPRKYAESNGIPFFTTSAKRGGPGIQFLFYSVAEKCIRQARERQIKQQQQQVAASSQPGGGGGFALGSAFGRPGGDDEDEAVHGTSGDPNERTVGKTIDQHMSNCGCQ